MTVFQELFDNYHEYHVSEINTNRFSPGKFQQELQPLLADCTLTKLGTSVEGRSINSVNIGNGPIKVLLWSQMHGNESTATRAILDILQFLSEPKKQDELKQKLLKDLTICFLPILNPDGTALFKRRNALNIDINRDAREFESPESQILKTLITEFKPDFAFNLHDQRRFYNITGTSKPSTIAFLAPAYNESEGVNPTRLKAMQLIAQLRGELETMIPGQTGIYADTYTPRAFGDYTQAEGVSTLLIESGWERHDMEKEFVRKLNFCLLVSALNAIGDEQFSNCSVEDYQAIPMNDERLFDLLIRNIKVEKNSQQFNYDIGIQRREEALANSSGYYSVGEVADLGDLKDWYGFTEVDGSKLIVTPGKVWQQSFATDKDISLDLACEMARQGYLYVRVEQKSKQVFVERPINIVDADFTPSVVPVFEGPANFLLQTSAKEIKYVVVNGFLWKIDEPMPDIINGIVL